MHYIEDPFIVIVVSADDLSSTENEVYLGNYDREHVFPDETKLSKHIAAILVSASHLELCELGG